MTTLGLLRLTAVQTGQKEHSSTIKKHLLCSLSSEIWHFCLVRSCPFSTSANLAHLGQFWGFLAKHEHIKGRIKYYQLSKILFNQSIIYIFKNHLGREACPIIFIFISLDSPLKYEYHMLKFFAGLHDMNSSFHLQGKKQKMNSLQSLGIMQLMLTSFRSPHRLKPSPTSPMNKTMKSQRSPSRTPRRTNGDARNRPAPNHGAPEQRSLTNNSWLWKTSSAQLGTCLYAKD